MDSAFDSSTHFSAEKSRKNIWMMLSSSNLEKYMDNLMEKGVDFHAFVNMTREDMRFVGITNHQDQDRLMVVTNPLKKMYQELDGRPTDVEKVVNSILDSMQTLGGTLVCLKQRLQRLPIEHSLIDHQTSTMEAFDHVLDLIESRIDLIEKDLTEYKDLHEKQEQKSFVSKRKAITFLALATIALVSHLLLKRH